jgi:hypothetical protein
VRALLLLATLLCIALVPRGGPVPRRDLPYYSPGRRTFRRVGLVPDRRRRSDLEHRRVPSAGNPRRPNRLGPISDRPAVAWWRRGRRQAAHFPRAVVSFGPARPFVVIAPFHGTSRLLQRPFQIREAVDEVTADPRFKPHVDATRLGMIGFSFGTAVTLMLAGATPDFAHLDACCDAHPTDVMSCDHAPGGGGRRTSAPPAGAKMPLPPPLPLKAIVLLDPFGALFSCDHLTSVTMPVLQFRPDHSQLPGEENSAGLAASLPRHSQLQIVPGTHFIFVDVCSPRMQTAASEACQDPPGVDRAAIHAIVERQIVWFLVHNL